MDEGTLQPFRCGSIFIWVNFFHLPFTFSLTQHFEHWPKNRPICVHAEEKSTAAVILLAELYKRHVHVCHVARREEVGVVCSYARIT